MSEIIGYEKKFFENAVITEEDIPSIAMKIRKFGKVEGKDLYGFFVTNEEFSGKLRHVYCQDGCYDIPVVRYDHGESIVLHREIQIEESKESSREYDKKVLKGSFIMQNESNVENKLKELNIPIRKIGIINKLGWAFAE